MMNKGIILYIYYYYINIIRGDKLMVDAFIELLKKVDSGEYDIKIVLTKDEIGITHEYIDAPELMNLAATHLITDRGGCDWNNIKKLNNAGFKVFAIEQDSFGWLIGGIRTNKGVIMYG